MHRRTVGSWHMREVMRERGVSVQDLLRALPEYDIRMSQSQVYREISGKQKTFSMQFAAVFCDIVDCSMNDIITVGFLEAVPTPKSPTGADLPRIGTVEHEYRSSAFPPLRPLL